MLKNLFTILTVILFSSAVYSQPSRGRGGFEQVEAEKTAYFTRALDLTSEEAREFWPVYDEFRDRKSAIIREKHSLLRYFTENYDNMDEKEAEEIAGKYLDLQIRETSLTEEFHEKFKKVLPPKKVMRFYHAENEFRMQLLRRIRGGGRGSGQGRPGGPF
jgi:Spy/CpxP family protein refolding chaperone